MLFHLVNGWWSDAFFRKAPDATVHDQLHLHGCIRQGFDCKNVAQPASVCQYSLEQTSGFLAKVGDYAYLLSRNAANGNVYSEEEYKNLTVLAEIAALLSQNLLSIQADMNDGKMTFQELSSSS